MESDQTNLSIAKGVLIVCAVQQDTLSGIYIYIPVKLDF